MAKWRAAGAFVAKPLTFMNLSGHAVGDLLRYFKIDVADLLVIVDELAVELGRLRTRARGSAGGHNGLKSLIEQLGTDQFAGCGSASNGANAGRDRTTRRSMRTSGIVSRYCGGSRHRGTFVSEGPAR
jgi:hypothetical protein